MRSAAKLLVSVTSAFVLCAAALGGCSSSDDGTNVINGDADAAQDADVPAIAETTGDDVAVDVPSKVDVFRPNDSVEPGLTGAPCRRNEDCESGWCVGWDEGYTCTNICLSSAGCREGWECRSVVGTAPDVVFVCYPDQAHLCRPCASDFECAGGYCVTVEGEQRCTRPCDELHTCPERYSCDTVASEEEPTISSTQCVPTSGSCTCGPINVGIRRSCSNENDYGTCWGAETCEEDTGWTGCTAAEPAEETCDGLDNDCDGIADNELVPPTEPCETSWEDPDGLLDDIVCVGAWVCRSSAGTTAWQCTAPPAGPEVCDRVDNDCDGETDEGFVDPDTGFYVTNEHCGQCNQTCEGSIPFAAETTCQTDDIGARCVVVNCQTGYFVPPDFDDICVRVGPVANCTPCSDDDDCAGLPGTCHEETESGRSYCAQDCPLGDECGDGFECTDGSCRPLSDSCNCLAQHEGLTRPCSVDNDFGVCVGLSTCAPETGWSACNASTPAEETCNGLDDDCDGQTDVGMEFPDGSPECENSNGLGTCTGSWICADVDGGTSWVCTAAEPTPEECDRRDNDCDGETDEDFRSGTTGHYVGLLNCGVCGYSCEGAIDNAAEVTCDDAGTVPQCAVVTCEEGFIPFGRFACVAAQGAACRPCEFDSDCPVPGDRCIVLDGAGVCGQDCSEGNEYGRPAGECPADFTCVTDPVGLGDDVFQCLPASGSCTCLPGDEGRTRPCEITNDAGTCFGRETCDPTVGWAACNASVPENEVCDGRDNNCNGLADEDVVPPDGSFDCSIDNEFGVCLGTWVCAAEGGTTDWRCSAPTPAPDVCDYIDNDCDGETDEFFPDRDDVCFAGVGECRSAGVRECVPDGSATVCTAEPDAEGVESCNGRDDDCDGGTDEDWPERNTPCAAGLGTCVRSGVWECDPGDPSAVRCNAVPGDASAFEACDYQDDDCDGQTDEDFRTAARYTDVMNCGACGNDCAAFWTPDAATFHAVPNCVDAGPVPSCGFTCDTLWFDVDGVASNGCELYADPAAIFVSAPTDDNAAEDLPTCGTWDRPCATISYGLQRADTTPGKERVLVSDGAYEENVTLIEGIDLLGGYNNANWQRNPSLNVTSIFGEEGGAGDLFTVLADGIENEETLVEGFRIYGRVATDRGANSYALRIVDCNENLVVRGNRVIGGYGGPGADGTAGNDGAAGPDGATGLAPFDTGTMTCADATRAGGSAGSQVCAGTTVAGGSGADAACPLFRNAPQADGDSGPNGGAAGGAGGFSSEISTYCSTCFTPINPDGSALSTAGSRGARGAGGTDGAGGEGCATTTGDVSGGHWRGDGGSIGVAGQAGRGGGGGGAGGGVNNAFTEGDCPTRGGDTLGGTGGGGGAGGCGATGGDGGGPGGGAFAIFVYFTVAPGSLPIIEDNIVRQGVGGPGGRGGAGGRGGVGGDGGDGGPEGAGISDDLWCAGAGGDGGRGGDGGHGGGGGGGCGGASYGVFVAGQGGLVPTWALGNDFRTTGAAGPGGEGGSAVRPELRGDDASTGAFEATNF